VPPSFDRYFAAGWIGLSGVLLTLYALVLVRFRRMQRGWTVVELCGVPVRLAPGGGPLVVGLSRSEIVVPRWLLGYGAGDQQLVSRMKANMCGPAIRSCLPSRAPSRRWCPGNPAVWWMLGRVRLGVELDCDVRVLRQGVATRTYGELLVDLAGRSSGLPFAVPALAASATHLRPKAARHENSSRAVRAHARKRASPSSRSAYSWRRARRASRSRRPAPYRPGHNRRRTETITLVLADSAARRAEPRQEPSGARPGRRQRASY